MHEFIAIEDIPVRELVPGFDARLMHMNGMTVAHVQVKAGSVLPEHHHIHEQVTNVISGELEMTVAGEKRVCKAGTAVCIPSNVPHSAIALTDCKIIDVFSPVREDYK